ncbi:Hypothetical predicted protein [Paramuricea clavata]|uniref:P2X purinoreceptor 7 intracellular domain-containing protein n=1 Tax=Paramuricea clavata TaxID=317549 RepID=A0A7D9DC26_PARCT|nr:Hypothetical predicted protein [Paramuricea clavata]
MEAANEMDFKGYEIQPYMFEPNPDDEIESEDSDCESTSTEDNPNAEFEGINSWRLTTLQWCKCGQCQIMTKTIESFCCHEKAVEYDEYDAKLISAQNQGLTCISLLPAFVQNMLSQDVLEGDVAQYLEDNSPHDDDDRARTHKLYRLSAYRRCSRWIFQILGEKCRRVFPSCIYTCIRKKFASPDGLYTHFKFAS